MPIFQTILTKSKKAALFPFKIPYWVFLFGPHLAFGLGFALNVLVMMVNHGKMPVYIPGGICFADVMEDPIHSCMVHQTHLKFLADWIFVRADNGIYSPGDFLEMIKAAVFPYNLVVWGTLVIHDRLKADEHRRSIASKTNIKSVESIT